MSTYATMRSDFVALLNRSDCADPNAALVKSFFTSAIPLIHREVRAWFMEKTLTVDTTTAVSTVALPSDWLETKAIVWDNGTTDSGEVDEIDIGTYYRRKNETFDVPTIATREGSNWLITAPFPATSTAKIIYWAKFPALVNDGDEPVIAQEAPDLIIRAALVYAGTYFIDDRKDGWQSEFEFLREQVQSASTSGDASPDGQAVQPFAAYDDHV